MLLKKSIWGILLTLLFGIPVALVAALSVWFAFFILFGKPPEYLPMLRWGYIGIVGVFISLNIVMNIWAYAVCLIYSRKWQVPFSQVEEGLVKYQVLRKGFTKWTREEFLEAYEVAQSREVLVQMFSRLLG